MRTTNSRGRSPPSATRSQSAHKPPPILEPGLPVFWDRPDPPASDARHVKKSHVVRPSADKPAASQTAVDERPHFVAPATSRQVYWRDLLLPAFSKRARWPGSAERHRRLLLAPVPCGSAFQSVLRVPTSRVVHQCVSTI